jgi:pimeloyl-ACP methyl ester carboxylesterase
VESVRRRPEQPLPWDISDFAQDVVDLIEGACSPPVAIVGLSFGGGIVQQVAIDRPDLLACAIPMGTGAVSRGWTWDYQMAEIEWRRAGNRLEGMMAVTHYAAMHHRARVLGDPVLWPKLRDESFEYYQTDTAEESLIAQWLPCVLFDQREQLPGVQVPMHVIAFDQDVQAVPQDDEDLAALVPTRRVSPVRGDGSLLDLRPHPGHPESLHQGARPAVPLTTHPGTGGVIGSLRENPSRPTFPNHRDIDPLPDAMTSASTRARARLLPTRCP